MLSDMPAHKARLLAEIAEMDKAMGIPQPTQGEGIVGGLYSLVNEDGEIKAVKVDATTLEPANTIIHEPTNITFPVGGDVVTIKDAEPKASTSDVLACSICGKECKNNTGLAAHMRSHK